mmetsp:Transcript_99179/g.214054  ORF Transcript_99179/g.214054 Transcript_99179/m.214054 type:complete len:593 (+) Transcript_99179:267-2045(+)
MKLQLRGSPSGRTAGEPGCPEGLVRPLERRRARRGRHEPPPYLPPFLAAFFRPSRCCRRLPVLGSMKPCALMVQPHVKASDSTDKHLKQKRVLQFRQHILWHSEYCVFWFLMFCLLTAILQVGHCLVPVSLSHLLNISSSFAFLLLAGRPLILSLCSSHVRPLWKGWMPHFRQQDFLQKVHFSLGTSPSSSATRMGQFGVGHAQRSGTEETACSKLRCSRRSMVSCGSSFRRSRSARGVQHSGHEMLAAPVESRASECLSMHWAQYHPWEQPRRTARQGGTSLQQISHISMRLFSRMDRGLDCGVGLSHTLLDGAGLHTGSFRAEEAAALASSAASAWPPASAEPGSETGPEEHGVAGGRAPDGRAFFASPSSVFAAAASLPPELAAPGSSSEASRLRFGVRAGEAPLPRLSAQFSWKRTAASRHHALASRSTMGSTSRVVPPPGETSISACLAAEAAAGDGGAAVEAATMAAGASGAGTAGSATQIVSAVALASVPATPVKTLRTARRRDAVGAFAMGAGSALDVSVAFALPFPAAPESHWMASSRLPQWRRASWTLASGKPRSKRAIASSISTAPRLASPPALEATITEA